MPPKVPGIAAVPARPGAVALRPGAVAPRPGAVAPRPGGFPHVWQAADTALRSANQASLTRRLQHSFTDHTLGQVGNFANSHVQNAAAMVAESCVAAVPVVNALPHVRQLASTLARKLAQRVSSKSVLTDALQKCGGTGNAAAMLALALASFMMHQAQAWGAHVDVDQTAYVLNQFASLTTAFLNGQDVDITPIVQKLAPARAATAPIWALIRSKALCAWCRQQCRAAPRPGGGRITRRR